MLHQREVKREKHMTQGDKAQRLYLDIVFSSTTF